MPIGMQKCVDEERTVKTPEYKSMEKFLARHEDVNGRLKEFGCLSKVHGNDRPQHHFLFGAAATVTQYLYAANSIVGGGENDLVIV